MGALPALGGSCSTLGRLLGRSWRLLGRSPSLYFCLVSVSFSLSRSCLSLSLCLRGPTWVPWVLYITAWIPALIPAWIPWVPVLVPAFREVPAVSGGFVETPGRPGVSQTHSPAGTRARQRWKLRRCRGQPCRRRGGRERCTRILRLREKDYLKFC